MAIAFSNLEITYLPSNEVASSLDLRNLIDTVLLDVAFGWSAADYGAGRLYRCRSPQGLEADLYVYDDGDYGDHTGSTGRYVKLQMRSTGGAQGQIHRLGFERPNPRNYAIWANTCQLFIWMPGIYSIEQPEVGVNEYWYHTFQCGIPRIPGAMLFGVPSSPCTVSGASSVSDCWWACSTGTYEQNWLQESLTFRNSHSTQHFWNVYGRAPYFDVMGAGGLFKSSDYSGLTDERWLMSRTALRLLPITVATDNARFPWVGRPAILEDGVDLESYLKYDPFIGWGPGPTADHLSLQGQLWDSVLISTMQGLDAEITVQATTDNGYLIDLPFVMFGHGERMGPEVDAYNRFERQIYGGSLALLKGHPIDVTPPGESRLINYGY